MVDVIKLISGMPLFAGLSKAQYEALARICVRRSCRKGERLFSEGDEGTGFYMVVTGRVKIFKVSVEGKEQILHLFGPGESFGEVSVFTGQGFPADAVTSVQTVLLFFPRVGLQRSDSEGSDAGLEHAGRAVGTPPPFRGSYRRPVAQGSAGEAGQIPPLSERRKGRWRGGSRRFQGAAGVASGDDPRDPLPDPRQDAPAGSDPLAGVANPDPRSPGHRTDRPGGKDAAVKCEVPVKLNHCEVKPNGDH